MHKAAFLTGIKKIELANAKEESFDGIKLKVDSCALCGSDIRIYNKGNDRIKYPSIIGHEISGTVVDTKTDKYKIGDFISIGADIPCGKCNFCKSKRPNLCEENLGIGYQLQGGFSEYMFLSKELVNNGPIKKVMNENNLEVSCLGEPVACAINGLEKLNIKNNSGKMIIFGAGPIGIILGKLAKSIYKLDKVDYVEVSDYRTKFLSSLDFANEILTPSALEANLSRYLDSYQYVITACSVLQTHDLGISLLSNGGAINFFGGLAKPAPSININTNDIHYKELTLTGSHGSTPLQHSKAIDLIIKEPVFFKKLITHRYKLDDIDDAFNLASLGEGIKIIIKP